MWMPSFGDCDSDKENDSHEAEENYIHNQRHSGVDDPENFNKILPCSNEENQYFTRGRRWRTAEI